MPRPVPGDPDNPPVTLGEMGEVDITEGALRAYASFRGLGLGDARRELMPLLLGARRVAHGAHTGAEAWRARSREPAVDLSLHVRRDRGTPTVVHLHARVLRSRPGSHKNRKRS